MHLQTVFTLADGPNFLQSFPDLNFRQYYEPMSLVSYDLSYDSYDSYDLMHADNVFFHLIVAWKYTTTMSGATLPVRIMEIEAQLN